ncbi:MAG: hypothetical protein ACRETA_04400 [Gammaproteobacteria bacterium]
MLEIAACVALLLIFAYTMYLIRLVLVYAGYILAAFTIVFMALWIYKWFMRYEHIEHSHHGGYLQRHGRLIEVKASEPEDGVSHIPVPHRVIPQYDYEYEPLPEPKSEDDPDIKPMVTQVLGSAQDDELALAARLWDAGATSRSSLAAAMTAASGVKVSTHKATQYIAVLRERKLI